MSVNLFVSGSRNVTINRNWVYANTDQYRDRPDLGYRAAGVELANEGPSAGWWVTNVRITNNIIEWVGQGIRYWRSRSGGTVADTYGNVYVGFNNFNRMQFSPMRFDTPDGGWPSAGSRLRANLVLNQSPYVWFSTEEPGERGTWAVTGTTGRAPPPPAPASRTPGGRTSPGLRAPGRARGGNPLDRGAVVRVGGCRRRAATTRASGQNDWNTPGAIN